MPFDKEKSRPGSVGGDRHSDPLMDTGSHLSDEDEPHLPSCDTNATVQFNAAVTEIIGSELVEDREESETAKRLTASGTALPTEIPPVPHDITVLEEIKPVTEVFADPAMKQESAAAPLFGQTLSQRTQVGNAAARSFSEIFGPNAKVGPPEPKTDPFGPGELAAQPLPAAVLPHIATSEEVVTLPYGSDTAQRKAAEAVAAELAKQTDAVATFANPVKPTGLDQPLAGPVAAASTPGADISQAKNPDTDPEPQIPQIKEPPKPKLPERQAGGFTMMLRGEALPLPPKPAKPAPQASAPAPAPQPPSQYTQVVSGGRWPAAPPMPPQPGQPPYPAQVPYDYSGMQPYGRTYAVPQPSTKKSKVLTYLPLIIAGNVFVVMALLLILFFALKR